MTNTVTAYHEAGHALACLRQGLTFDRIVLHDEKTNGAFGAIEVSPASADTLDGIRADLLAILAGPAAEALQLVIASNPGSEHEFEDYVSGASLHLRNWWRCSLGPIDGQPGQTPPEIFRAVDRIGALQLAGDPTADHAWIEQALQLVADSWPAVGQLAQALIERRTLSIEDARRIVETVDEDFDL